MVYFLFFLSALILDPGALTDNWSCGGGLDACYVCAASRRRAFANWNGEVEGCMWPGPSVEIVVQPPHERRDRERVGERQRQSETVAFSPHTGGAW
ncbi:hypothetical protein BZA05DRAFT_384108 [Tricharina praecox]|uniref:uncharacterized protein n=1 Tax=Tricharina praecox TaxID=43433 RepID=UPI002220C195|nr:uncharacterized protein BZA05DRAFT_384108 [Tricharina praecox]KAI5857610.1 hypothetical protein BZA05DRAFT_384108 [Tricharina praecox]